VGHLLFFAVGAWPPHDGVRKAKRPNLSRDPSVALLPSGSGLCARSPPWCANSGDAIAFGFMHLCNPDCDWHAEPCHPVENVACNLHFGPLIGQNPCVEAPVNGGS
jgi:hypothetical protein